MINLVWLQFLLEQKIGKTTLNLLTLEIQCAELQLREVLRFPQTPIPWNVACRRLCLEWLYRCPLRAFTLRGFFCKASMTCTSSRILLLFVPYARVLLWLQGPGVLDIEGHASFFNIVEFFTALVRERTKQGNEGFSCLNVLKLPSPSKQEPIPCRLMMSQGYW